ncbi:type I restriction-modification system subunit M N-terminal domain-containing protein [Sedimentisphaera salicampi]|uniref:Type I restriction-modification system methyltransferase subunit n=1 Tax=Sedimentisphaera salicampi TaxID=1941349 RepID=A0A1W6LM86_9BACT|nr:type I restriction-modification system subunit M N-terminal domain-containing protein [Sedimentisphaera salicampi]ARN56866.1 Type I restriction-modification system methyltransferase subunit [Sedimentisphaera salicampi]
MADKQGKANFIWKIADDILRGSFKAHEYGDVILPFVVLRRLDCVLEPTKDKVIETYNQFKDKNLPDISGILLNSTINEKSPKGLNFYNT